MKTNLLNGRAGWLVHSWMQIIKKWVCNTYTIYLPYPRFARLYKQQSCSCCCCCCNAATFARDSDLLASIFIEFARAAVSVFVVSIFVHPPHGLLCSLAGCCCCTDATRPASSIYWFWIPGQPTRLYHEWYYGVQVGLATTKLHKVQLSNARGRIIVLYFRKAHRLNSYSGY